MTNFKINDAVAHPLAPFRNHLEFHGYRIEEEEDLIFCHHQRKHNLILRSVPDRGVLVSTIYHTAENVRRIELLEYINRINGDILFSKAYVDDEDSFIVETFFEGEYDRTNFSLLLENIDFDISIISNDEMTERFIQ